LPNSGECNDTDKAKRNFFYLALTRTLNEAYGAPVGPELDALEASIYFLYQHVMHVDAAIDGQQPLLLPRGNAYLVLGLDQMRAAISTQQQFNALRAMSFRQMQATLATVEMERFEGDVPRLGYDGYAAIARQKCVMADLVPHALACMHANDGIEDVRDAQVTSLAHVHIGMQWVDDLADLDKDRANRQPSLLWSRLSDWAMEEGIDLANVDDRRLRQLAYISGLASKALTEGIAEFRSALTCVAHLRMGMYERMLQSMITAQESNVALISQLIESAKQKAVS
jgi:hypothetical protein